MTTLLVAAPTWAQQIVPTRGGSAIQVGLRFGYGLPFGKTGRTSFGAFDEDILDTIKAQIPIGVDLGYLFTPRLYVGLSFMYGFGSVGGDASCMQPDTACSTSDTDLSVGVQFHPERIAAFDPWIGVGVGYERLDSSITVAPQNGTVQTTTSVTRTGFELVKIQVGGDIIIAPNVAVGPFVSLSAGRYGSISQMFSGGPNASQDIAGESFHEWLLLGVRGLYNVRL